MPSIVLLFLVIFFLNLIPAFAPPTWMVFSYLGFRNPSLNVGLLAVVGAGAATLGRLTLAKMAHVIIRQRFLSDDSKQNIDSIREGLKGRRKLTFSVFLFYAFSPLPSNFLFIAYGLTTMELKLIASVLLRAIGQLRFLGTHFLRRVTPYFDGIWSDFAVPGRVLHHLPVIPLVSGVFVYASRLAHSVRGKETKLDTAQA